MRKKTRKKAEEGKEETNLFPRFLHDLFDPLLKIGCTLNPKSRQRGTESNQKIMCDLA